MFLMTVFAIAVILLIYLLSKNQTKRTNEASYIARAATIAAIYVLVTYIFKPISYGPVQVRVSEALTLLPLLEHSSIPGLFIGCLLSNILGNLGLWDVFLGSLITLVAAYLTSKMPGLIFGVLPPILLNAFGVSYYLSKIYNVQYWITVLYIGLGQLISVVGLGVPLFYLIQKSNLTDIFKKSR